MAKHNDVPLYAQVMSKRITKKDGEYKQGLLIVNIVRGQRDTGNKQISLTFDLPFVISLNPSIIKRMEELEVNDIIYIKGVFTTSDIPKNTTCPKCGGVTTRKGTMVHITPIHLLKIRSNLLKDEAVDFLKENCELSNCVTVIGTLTDDPKSFVTQHGLTLTNYTLQVGRKYRIKEDSIQTRNDFPMIRSFGRIAKSNAEALRKDSLVAVHGVLQTRKYDKKMECVHCGESYKIPDSTMEIVPYSVEYLQNYRTKEEIERERESTINPIQGPVLISDDKINDSDIRNAQNAESDIHYIEFNDGE